MMSKQTSNLYVDYDDDKFSENILIKKEFNIYSNIKNIQEENLLFNIEPLIIENRILKLESYQLFVRNFLNPETPYNRLLLKWEVGMGKTIAALSIAFKFIQLYKKRFLVNELDDKIGKICIIGLTKEIFIRDLLNFPDFGFIKRREIIEKEKLDEEYKNNPNDTSILKNREHLRNITRRRIKTKNVGGFFEFYTYMDLVKYLYITDKSIDILKLSEKEINDAIAEKKIELNKEFLTSMKNSLLICDEIHNVYNSTEKNNWGVALQTILNQEKTIKALFLSATPITHNPSEIVDLLSLLYHKKIELNKKDFFKEEELLPNALEKISKLTTGKISFLKNMNPKYFAKKNFVGESINDIEYLKFIRCEMSQLHYNTYKKFEKDENIIDLSNISDMILPNPEDENIGLVKMSDIKHKIHLAPKEWKIKHGIDFINDKIKGNILSIDNIKKYSSKYYNMYNKILDLIKNKKGKIFIYHKHVHGFGILFLEEFFIKNGFIKYDMNANNTSLCIICLLTFDKHENIKDHEFKPIKIVSIHGELSDSHLNEELEIFNNKNNTYGTECLILLGSKKIQESYNLKSVRNIFIITKPINIAIFNQIIGRALRKQAHILLPKDQQNVDIYIYVSSFNDKNNLTYEEQEYKRSIKKYLTIQKIEKILNSNSIDSIINKDIIWTKEIIENYDKSNEIKSSMLKYDIPKSKIYNLDELDKSTYNIYYNNEEIDTIKLIIKRLFIQVSRIWDYETLWNYVKNPPFPLENNTKLFSEDLFILALSYLLWNQENRYINNIYIRNIDITNPIIKLFDPSERIIIMPNRKDESIICQVGKYYILFPLNDRTKNPMIDVELPYRDEKKIMRTTLNISNLLTKLEKNKSINDEFNILFKNIDNIKNISRLTLLKDNKKDINILLLEKTIEYFSSIINNKKYDIKLLSTYIKILLYYNINGCVIWLGSIDTKIITLYNNYLNKFTHTHIKKDIIKKFNINNINIFFSNSHNYFISEYYINNSEYKEEYTNMLHDIILKNYENKKISFDIVPVGYVINNIVLYDSGQGWSRYLNINDHSNYSENDTLIGYMVYEDDIKFKIRPPLKYIHSVKDHRLIEKGIVCNTKSKNYLLMYINKLLNITGGYKLSKNKNNKDINKQTIKSICEIIKNTLLMKQILSYHNNEKIRWFYMLSEME